MVHSAMVKGFIAIADCYLTYHPKVVNRTQRAAMGTPRLPAGSTLHHELSAQHLGCYHDYHKQQAQASEDHHDPPLQDLYDHHTTSP